MINLSKWYLVLSILGFVSLMIFIYKQKENGTEEKTDARTKTVTEARAKLDSFEDRRCEGKIYTSPMPLKLKHRQYSRKILLRKKCNANSNLDITGKWKSFDDIPNEELHNLLVDDRHGIIYCYVPKVACTAWKRIMIVLSESLRVYGVPFRNPLDIPIQYVHGLSLRHLNLYPKAVMKQKLQTYKKFIFVRDPFVRLVSAYKNKIQSPIEPYYKTIGKKILKQFGNVSNPASVEQAYAQGIVPSFSDFIQYILSLPARNYAKFDEHWKPTVHMCHPCMISYDFIGKMETIEDDAAHLLRLLKVDNIVNLNPQAKNKTSADEMKTWFSNIPTEWSRKLYDIYRTDFELFGY
ncbi:carbohydrate sulfotransferase 12-like [Tachysurus fulvidraco]|uniref:carbohydrate sulfotransferase 12-like n=1 Tax=Tachysurus fulvidraco TaxID=1234273 RepID=UPI001FF02E34|nr:carbohydrate sulfotransferase 12-like [Tachysurus fulvidraco]